MTNRVQVCVCTLGPVYQDPGCTEANQRLAPQRKILNTHTPFLPFSYHSLPSLPPAFILCFSFGLISCRMSFRVAVTIDTRRGKKPVERKKRERKTLCSTWWLIFDGQFPHEFPIAFHSGLVMCRRLRMEIVWLDAQLIISIKWPFHFSINKQEIQKLNEDVSPSVGKSANFFVPKIEHAIVFLSSFDTVF